MYFVSYGKGVPESTTLAYGRIILEAKITIGNSLYGIVFCIFPNDHSKSTIFAYEKSIL